ncbi:DUF3616 domain-containing protein [Methyloglobulus sp.]|uniref:DUF3616 domain-containing protein n=1 Tax=Methyloglobulus sp. TaxID=2518622 RepID=UPI0032B74B13
MKTNSIQEKKYSGISNPSGAVALNDNLFIVADDEDNVLRIYDRNVLDKPLQSIKLSAVFKGEIEDGEDLEIDLESAAEIGRTVFWIGSHSSSRTGEYREARHRILAVNIKLGAKDKYSVTAVGIIYKTLIADLQDDSRFNEYHFGKAKKTQAKALGGLSIEGLASTPDNGLLIGFRNPLGGGDVEKGRLEKGKALIVKLKNPFEVIHGLKAKFADPIVLDLDGFGIREITRRKKHKYLVVAGPYHENIATEDHKKEAGKLYKWSSKSGKLNELKRFDLDGYNIEAALFYPGNDDCVQLLSDDGTLEGANGFRSLTLTL